MSLKIFAILTLTTLFLLPLISNAATYNYYFSDDAAGNPVGNDTTGSGTKANPWKTLSKAQSAINDLNSGDTANLYFDRGDTWSMNTGAAITTITFGLLIDSSDPVVNIDAYGSGDRPCFEGGVTDFSTAASHNQTTGPLLWSNIFEFRRINCSVSNIEIKEVYGNGIEVQEANGFVLADCEIHHFGSAAIAGDSAYEIEDITVERNLIYVGQQLWRYLLRNGWGGGIQLNSKWQQVDNNIVRYNVMYDIYGEGINCPNSLIEYNVVGDTASTAINTSTHFWNAHDCTVRYNFVTMSDWTQSVYDGMHGGGSSPIGIRIFDEEVGGDNSQGIIEIYGNIVINRGMGIWFYNNRDVGNPYGIVKIYNNTVIDCHYSNFYISDPEECNAGYVYNNSSILYDRTSSNHTNTDKFPHDNWTVENNHFWTTGGSPSVGTGWEVNYVTTDPKLPGEPAIDWDGLTGANYFRAINFSHLYPPPDSGLVWAGKRLGSGYNNMFLTIGTDFNKLPDKPTFRRRSQPDSSKWVIGAIIPAGDSPGVSPPASLGIKIGVAN